MSHFLSACSYTPGYRQCVLSLEVNPGENYPQVVVTFCLHRCVDTDEAVIFGVQAPSFAYEILAVGRSRPLLRKERVIPHLVCVLTPGVCCSLGTGSVLPLLARSCPAQIVHHLFIRDECLSLLAQSCPAWIV